MKHLVTITTFLPLAGAAVLLLYSVMFGRDGDQEKLDERYRWITLIVTIITFTLSLSIIGEFDPSVAGPQLTEKAPWIGSLGANYYVGVDGISVWLVILTTFLMPISALASWGITKRVREYMLFMLLLETGMIGVFVAWDLLLFYLFFEITLIPMYFLIGVWGGERRIYAAIKFFVYTVVGSLLMLVALIAVYFYNAKAAGAYSFDIFEITNRLASNPGLIPQNVKLWLWLAFALAFFIKVPLFPFHTWLPDAHVEAPTAGSIILAGVLLKMGT